MKIFSLSILISFALSSANLINDGNKLYAQENYAGALEKYRAAQKENPADPILFYNIGTCEYKLGNYDEAIKELESAVRMPDSSLAAKAAYNLANTLFRAGEKSELAQKIESWRQSIGYLKKAIDLAPDFEKAKKNVEIVQRRLKEAIDEQKENNEKNNSKESPPMSERAKEALARALQQVAEGNYPPAKGILETVIAEDESASGLSSYVDRIDDLIEIQAGRKPQKKIDASNSTNDLEVI